MTKADLHRMVDQLPEAAVDGVSVILEAVVQGRIDPTQAWFWTPDWQAGERDADDDIAAGRVERFDDERAFVAALERGVPEAGA